MTYGVSIGGTITACKMSRNSGVFYAGVKQLEERYHPIQVVGRYDFEIERPPDIAEAHAKMMSHTREHSDVNRF